MQVFKQPLGLREMARNRLLRKRSKPDLLDRGHRILTGQIALRGA